MNQVASKPKFRGTSHFYTFLASLIAGVILITFSEGLLNTSVNTIFSLSVTMLFGVSATYHLLYWTPQAEKRMRALDHSSIYLLIAGTYTSLVVTAVEWRLAVNVLIFVWSASIFGCMVEFFVPRIPPRLSAVIYVALGWTAIFVIQDFISNIGILSTFLIFLGGMFYTIGAAIYALKRPNPWPDTFGYHEVFHIFVIAGATFHYYVIMKMHLFN